MKHESANQLIAALRLGPVASAIDASCNDFVFYTSGILDSSTGCGTSVNYAILVVGYDADQSYFIVQNSVGTAWGQAGYAYIAVEDGVGTLGLQTEPTIPNLLITSDNVQTGIIFALLGISCLVMLPLSFYFWHLQKDQLHFLHPGQMILRKVMWFELVYVVLSTIVMLCGESQHLQVWDVEAADIFLLLLCVNITMMVLHYAMGAQEKFSDQDSHLGSPLTGKIACIIVIALFTFVTVLAWVYIGVSMQPATNWTSPTNAGAFAFFHDMQTYHWINWSVDALCAAVQAIKVVDYYKHYSNNKNEMSSTHSFTSEDFDSSNINRQHAKMSLVNAAIALFGFCLVVVDMALISHYQRMGNIMFNAYFVLAVFVQIPMLHVMIVRQENKQQKVRGRAESWVQRDYENALSESINSIAMPK